MGKFDRKFATQKSTTFVTPKISKFHHLEFLGPLCVKKAMRQHKDLQCHPCALSPLNRLNAILSLLEKVRRGCSQSELQVTNFFSWSEECGEVFGDKN